MTSWTRLATAPWVHAGVLGAITVAVVLQYGFYEFPLVADRAYFVYLGQTVLRGDSIYATTFMPYPPLGPMLSAASMGLLSGFVPTYLAPRYASVALAVFCSTLLYFTARRATGSAGAGILASLVLAGLSQFAGFSIGTLEPKMLVACFSLLACLGVQRSQPWLAGAAAGLAASCWPPAGVVVLASCIASVFGAPAHRWRAFRSYAAGMLLGLAPALAYLTALNAWGDFWQRAFVIAAASEAGDAGVPLSHYGRVLRNYFGSDLAFLVASAAGFLAFAIGTARRGPGGLVAAWLDPRLGGLPLFTVAWLAFSAVIFQGAADVMPLFPLIAFWSAWAVHRLGETLGRAIGFRRTPAIVLASCSLAATVYGFSDAIAHEPEHTLADEIMLVQSIVAPSPDDSPVAAFGAEEVYALSQRPSPNKFLRLNFMFGPFLDLVEPGGCDGLLKRTLETAGAVVIWGPPLGKRFRGQHACIRRLERRLIAEGYERSDATLTTRRLGRQRLEDLDRRPWKIYRPAPRGGRAEQRRRAALHSAAHEDRENARWRDR